MSSFIRKGGAPVAELGTRPGPAGQTLISSGQADMDRLLGGGLPLGSLTLILEDGWSQHHIALLRYFLGEGAACCQKTLLATASSQSSSSQSFLPRLMDSAAAAAEKEREKKANGGGGADEDAVQLKIAWQYGRYLKPSSQGSTSSSSSSRSSSSDQHPSPPQQQQPQPHSQRGGNRPAGRDWCHTFDLSKNNTSSSSSSSSSGSGGKDVLDEPETLTFITRDGDDDNTRSSSSSEGGSSTRESFISSLATFVEAAKAQKSIVGRIAIVSLGSYAWGVGLGCDVRALVQTLIQIKAAVRDTKCCAMVSVPAGRFTASDQTCMAHVADTVLALEALQDDADIIRFAPDPQSVAGLLHLQKLSSMGALAAPAPQNPLYLVRQKRRRLAITPVEIDPDAEADDGERSGGGGKSSAAALLCGGGPAKGKQDLEF